MILPCLAWEFWKYIDVLVIAELFEKMFGLEYRRR